MPCNTVPAVIGVTAQPAYIETVAIDGWNAGANSIAICNGDCYFKWDVNDDIVGAVAGIGPVDRPSYNYAQLTHAFQILTLGGVRVYQVVELGAYRGELAEHFSGDDLYIRRVRGIVEYKVGGVVVYTSRTRSVGSIRAGGVLYLSGDLIE